MDAYLHTSTHSWTRTNKKYFLFKELSFVVIQSCLENRIPYLIFIAEEKLFAILHIINLSSATHALSGLKYVEIRQKGVMCALIILYYVTRNYLQYTLKDEAV